MLLFYTERYIFFREIIFSVVLSSNIVNNPTLFYIAF